MKKIKRLLSWIPWVFLRLGYVLNLMFSFILGFPFYWLFTQKNYLESKYFLKSMEFLDKCMLKIGHKATKN